MSVPGYSIPAVPLLTVARLHDVFEYRAVGVPHLVGSAVADNLWSVNGMSLVPVVHLDCMYCIFFIRKLLVFLDARATDR